MNIQDEIKQSIPFPTPNQEAVVALMRTTSMLKTQIDKVVQAGDVTGPQYNVLRVLRGAKSPLSTYEVGSRLIEHNPGISRMMDRLEKKGLISRSRKEDDRRCVLCSITDKGKHVLDDLDAPVTEAGEQLFQNCSSADVATFIKVLTQVRSSIRESAQMPD